MSTSVLGSNSFFVTPDVNGTLVLLVGDAVQTINGTTNQITISGTNPTQTVAIANNAILPGTASLTVPMGTTAQRPGSPTDAMLRYNSDLDNIEYYRSVTWVQSSGVIAKSVVTTTLTTTGGGNILSITIPGGLLTTTNALRIKSAGTWANTSGANRTVTPTISYGGTTMWADTSASLATGNTIGWSLDLILASNNSATAQSVNGVILLGSTGTVTTGITGNLGTATLTGTAILTGTSAVNSATNQTLTISVAFSGATISWSTYYYIVEVI